MSAETAPSMSEDLLALRDITRRTGIIHEAQALQLRIWPHLKPIFDGYIETHEVVPDNEQRTLLFRLVLKKKLPGGDALKKRVRLLESWCRNLLGKEWQVAIEAREKGGKKYKPVHRGRRAQAVPGKAQPAEEYGIQAMTEFKRYSRKNPTVPAEDLGPLIPEKS